MDESKTAIPYEKSDRGFKFYEPIPTRYGHILEVSESSTASEPSLWLRVDHTGSVLDADAKNAESSVHMSVEQAELLRDTLDVAIKQHYQFS